MKASDCGYTTKDLHGLPDDRRWELIEGSLTVLRDTETKRALYARAGVPAYWIVVPDADKPTISLAELVLDEPAGQYRFATHYTTEVFETRVPWPIRVDLPQLIARRARMMRIDPE